jgi:arginine utilization protein RocB
VKWHQTQDEQLDNIWTYSSNIYPPQTVRMSNHDEEEAIKAAEEASRLAAHKPANWKDKLPSFSQTLSALYVNVPEDSY